ncbi:Calx-beta domain-containing protein [Microbulbifer sp. ALW1]|uniref:golvesin C-terminal-like domain-containing protein n=1 Tax=Microbulbifer sp. (strain ALW1) TaxID=1516059 RepID=UPI001359CFB7|nr:Calx-beta domain-containing protein [Microbulbifer sp. ALW1]
MSSHTAHTTRASKIWEKGARLGSGISLLSLCIASVAAGAAEYTINTDSPRQVIQGLGVELQLDSIGSGNNGLPEQVTGIPHDLIHSERERLNNEMLQGFRYARLAMGLYYRGLTLDEKYLAERYPGHLEETRSIIMDSGMEGASAEYWSQTPYWKSTNSYIGGELRDDIDYEDFGDAVIKDIQHFEQGGIPVVRWSLQNEPFTSNNRYSNTYFPSDGIKYYEAYLATASKVRAYNPDIFLHSDSGHGQKSSRVDLIHEDPAALALVDGWSWHKIGTNSNDQIKNADYYNSETHGKPVYNNEFEYLDGKTSVDRMINTAQSIMNWMTFMDSPTWYWLHALKPSYNKESEGYGLGLWRPGDDNNFDQYSHIAPHHWDYLNTNWNGIAGFVKYMPWDSVRQHVNEQKVRFNQRIMSWKTPSGQMVFALTNRNTTPFTYTIDISKTSGAFTGRRFDVAERDAYIGEVSGASVAITVPPQSVEFWVEYDQQKPTFSISTVGMDICENAAVKRSAQGPCAQTASTGVLKVKRIGGDDRAVTVQLVDRSSANAGEDFASIPLTAHFDQGQDTVMIPVAPIDDTQGETTENISFELAIHNDYNVAAANRATIKLHDDGDDELNWVGVYPVSDGAESGMPVVVELVRSGDLSRALDVNYQLGGSATGGSDYSILGNRAYFASGQERVRVEVPVLDDRELEEHETLSVALLPSDKYYVSSPIATQKITDDERPLTLVVDNADAGRVAVNGDWATSSFSDERHGADYLHDRKNGKGSKSVTFSPLLPSASAYAVSVIYSAGNDRANNVPVTINHAGGSNTVTVNQQENGGNWVGLGEYQFSGNNADLVTIANTGTSGFVMADAVRFEDLGTVIDNTQAQLTGSWNVSSFAAERIGGDYLHDRNMPKGELAATYAWQAPTSGDYIVYVYYNSLSDRATNVPVTVEYADGSETVTIDQTRNGGAWQPLGVFPLEADQTARVTISNAGTDGFVIADAIRWVAVAR